MKLRENKTQYAILGMLSFAPKSCYDISQTIAHSTAFFWAESDGQLYPILKKLCAKHLVTVAHEKKSGKHAKKIYSITNEGKKVLTDWLEQSPVTFNYRNEFLLQLFFGRNIPKKKNIEKIKAYQSSLEQQLKLFGSFEDLIHEKSKDPTYSLLTLAFGQQSVTAEITWCKHAIKTLENHRA